MKKTGLMLRYGAAGEEEIEGVEEWEKTGGGGSDKWWCQVRI